MSKNRPGRNVPLSIAPTKQANTSAVSNEQKQFGLQTKDIISPSENEVPPDMSKNKALGDCWYINPVTLKDFLALYAISCLPSQHFRLFFKWMAERTRDEQMIHETTDLIRKFHPGKKGLTLSLCSWACATIRCALAYDTNHPNPASLESALSSHSANIDTALEESNDLVAVTGDDEEDE